MDHPLQAPDALIRPWRTAAYVAVAVAAVELLLLLVIGGGKLTGFVADRIELAAQDQVTAPQKQQRAKPVTRKPASAAVAKRTRSKTVVLVLNGNGRTGAAASAATRVRSRGYKIGAVTNAPRQVSRSIVMYKPGFAGEGRRLGKDLGVRLVTPLDGMRAGQLGRAHVVFILGPSHAAATDAFRARSNCSRFDLRHHEPASPRRRRAGRRRPTGSRPGRGCRPR